MTVRSDSILKVGALAPVDLDPRTTQDWLSAAVLRQVYETPFAPPDSGQVSRPEIFAGPLRGTEKRRAVIRNDLRFSDGTVVTAEHVARCLSRAANLEGAVEVSADGATVIFRQTRPMPDWI